MIAAKVISLFSSKKKPRRRTAVDESAPRKNYFPEARDVFLFGGLGAVGYGVYQIYPPSAYIIVGGCFIALGILVYMAGEEKK